MICGDELKQLQAQSTSEENVRAERDGMMMAMLDIFGIDFEHELANYLSESNTKLTKERISSLGKILVDPKGVIFYACTIKIGPLKFSAVSSDFSLIPFDPLCNIQFMEGNPIFGESPLLNSVGEDTALFFMRGKVSFATKALLGQSFGAKVIIIAQNEKKWPFLMTDTSSTQSVAIPVLMISETDGKILQKFLRTNSSRNIVGSIECKKIDDYCIICQENIIEKSVIYRLYCGHIYHDSCLERWLEAHATCPVCRSDLNDREMTEENH